MLGGLVQPAGKGTPQGGPLSPLLSNILLGDPDKQLEARGHAFCRYADDCNIHVATRRSGERAMASVTRFLERRMKLKINYDKSAVEEPVNRVFPGYSFMKDKASARRSAGNGRGRWYNSAMAFLQTALPSKTFADMGLVSLLDLLKSAQARLSVQQPPDA